MMLEHTHTHGACCNTKTLMASPARLSPPLASQQHPVHRSGGEVGESHSFLNTAVDSVSPGPLISPTSPLCPPLRQRPLVPSTMMRRVFILWPAVCLVLLILTLYLHRAQFAQMPRPSLILTTKIKSKPDAGAVSVERNPQKGEWLVVPNQCCL